jgi:NADPH-dependent 2,4-dienoyl-CoA reductase/sulfur reductase-like enzyme
MTRFRYLIVGGGMAADAAAHGIRERDADGAIGLVSAERHPPYSRPPLSKALWKGAALESIWRDTASAGVDIHLGRRIVRLDPHAHVAVDDEGTTYEFERALLATGGRPRRLSFGGESVIYFRGLDDYLGLRARVSPGTRVAVIGGGFIGSELAAALASNGARVTMVFPEGGIGARAFGTELSAAITEMFRAKGVAVIANDVPVSVADEANHHVVRTRGGRVVPVDVVVAGLGLEPDMDLARAAGLATSDGIEVDARLRTSHPDVFAAGDVASVMSPVLGRRVRVEHEDAALTMGRAAGRSMAGDETPYAHVPYFYSDLFDIGYEAVGELNARLEQVTDGRLPDGQGVVYYLRDRHVRGVLLWNLFGKVDEARALLADRKAVGPEGLRGRIAVGVTSQPDSQSDAPVVQQDPQPHFQP